MDSTNRNTALASALVEELARCGVRNATISPGSRSTPIALALHRHPAIETAVILDERSAGFFALGAAQATGLPAVVACTSGSAAANLHPAVVEADDAGVALLILTSDRPPELRGIGAGQTIDQIKLYGSAVRWFCEVGTHKANDVGLLHYRATACRAFAAARGEPRPGPVHLNLSWRDPLGPAPESGDVSATSTLALEGRGERPLTTVSAAPTRPDPATIDALADKVARTPRGLIVAGRQIDPSLREPLARLAALSGYPILAEPTSQLRLGAHDRSRVIWAYDSIARSGPPHLAPDLVIRFGDMPTSKSLRGWISELSQLYQVVVDDRFGWQEPSRFAETIVRADPVLTADAISDLISSASGAGESDYAARSGDWEREWVEAGALAAKAITAGLAAFDEPTEPAAHALLSGLYRNEELVYTASSMPIRDQEAFALPGPARVHFLCNRGANGLDGLISSGIGAAAASGRPAWILTGDLGLLHDSNGLAALRHARAPVRIVVFNNNGGGIFEFLPQADEMERDEFETLFATPAGLDLGRLAALYEVAHRRVSSLDEIANLTAETAIIEIPVERSANVGVHRRLNELAAAALDAASADTRPTAP